MVNGQILINNLAIWSHWTRRNGIGGVRRERVRVDFIRFVRTTTSEVKIPPWWQVQSDRHKFGLKQFFSKRNASEDVDF